MRLNDKFLMENMKARDDAFVQSFRQSLMKRLPMLWAIAAFGEEQGPELEQEFEESIKISFYKMRSRAKDCAPKDPALIHYVNAKLEKFIPKYGEFIASAEDDRTLVALMGLEQYIGREIIWVRGKSFDTLIDEKWERVKKPIERRVPPERKEERKKRHGRPKPDELSLRRAERAARRAEGSRQCPQRDERHRDARIFSGAGIARKTLMMARPSRLLPYCSPVLAALRGIHPIAEQPWNHNAERLDLRQAPLRGPIPILSGRFAVLLRLDAAAHFGLAQGDDGLAGHERGEQRDQNSPPHPFDHALAQPIFLRV